jgi:hypothetical protein
MNENNFLFLHEYILLDNLCKDMIGVMQNGVSAYLDEMDENHEYAYIIRDWDEDYENLKQYRYLRNRLTHENNALYEEQCTDEDIEWIKKFRNKILQSKDPLTRLYKHKKQIADRRKQELLQAEENTEAPKSFFEIIIDAIRYFFNSFR